MSEPSAPNRDPQQQAFVEQHAPQGMDLREFVSVLLAGKWWIVGITALGLVLGLLYAFLATPIYRADAMLQIQQQNSPLSDLAGSSDALSSLFGSNTLAQAEIQIMASRAVLDPVIRKFGLNVAVKGAPYAAVTIKTLKVPSSWQGKKVTLESDGEGAYTLLDPNGGKVLNGRVGEAASNGSGDVKISVSRLDIAAGKSATLVFQPVQEAFEGLERRLNAVELGQYTGIVQLSLTGPHPEQIQDVLNALVNQYLQQNVAAYATQATRSLKFVRQQLPALKQRMNQAESRLTTYQVKHSTVNIDEQAKALLQQFNTLEGELSQLELAQAALGEQYTRKYPAYAAIQKQQVSVKAKIATLQSRLDQLPKNEQGYVRLKRDAKVYTTLYTTLLGKEQDLRVAAAAAVGSARVVDYAVAPLKPVKPNKRLVVILGILLGFGFGMGVVFLRRALSHGLSDPVEIEQRFGIPLYAVVPHSNTEKRLKKRRHGPSGMTETTILAHDMPHEPAVEALRSLRTSLEFALRDARNSIVGLSGPAPGVGKSFVTANLAYLAATGGRRTLVVDGDLRKGHLQRYLGQPYTPGLAGLLAGQAEMAECVRSNLLGTSLDFVAAGVYPPNPAELFLKHDIGGLLVRMSKDYDLVLVDLPPLLSVTDPVIAMRATGLNLIVLRAGRHSDQEVAYALGRLRQNDVTVTGILLNDLTRHAGSYGYGGGYYHGYDYSTNSKRS
ncbi:MAG: polysaccharide biosynthesis tyrosine autokinase [Gammaproteobacteria bacterium]